MDIEEAGARPTPSLLFFLRTVLESERIKAHSFLILRSANFVLHPLIRPRADCLPFGLTA